MLWPVPPIRSLLWVSHRLCGDVTIEGWPASVKVRPVGDLAAPGRTTAPLVTPVRTTKIPAISDLSIALRLQRNLFTHGGRLTHVDSLTTTAELVPSIRRTARATDWAMQLRVAWREKEKLKEKGRG
jgi:hypothetical protein